METISPVLSRAYALLCTDIFRHLDDAEYLAQFDFWDEEQVVLVRDTILSLTVVVRGIVAAHQSDETGVCRSCDTPWPCQVTECVHGLVKDPDQAFLRIVRLVNGSD